MIFRAILLPIIKIGGNMLEDFDSKVSKDEAVIFLLTKIAMDLDVMKKVLLTDEKPTGEYLEDHLKSFEEDYALAQVIAMKAILRLLEKDG
jgi:hypothetical protein